MKERIKELLESYQVTPSTFAESLGVQRSNVSHVLSGRNKPGFDFIQKILTTYTEINAEWLLTGRGEMKKELNKNTVEDTKVNSKPSVEITKVNNVGSDLYSKQTGKKIKKIILFYEDDTFSAFNPSD
jgi:transcriptional regulator with XRE-family HTH domain